MGYKHIENLYQTPWFLTKYKQVYALEKIHGTSARVTWNPTNNQLHLHPGGETYENFLKAFNMEELRDKISKIDQHVIFYGEAYGGRQQKMSQTYGPNTKFIVFDVSLNNKWLNVSEAHKLANSVGLEFVHYQIGPNTVEWLESQRDSPSVQAIRNGMGNDKIREGIVIRPVEKQTCMVKFKRPEFCETASQREAKLKFANDIVEAEKIAEEWVTLMRGEHVLDQMLSKKSIQVKDISIFLDLMNEDIKRESKGQITWSNKISKQIRKKAAILFKENFL